MIQISSEAAPVVRKPFYRHLYFQVLLAIFAGGLIGHFFPTFGESLKPLGDAFIKLVKMIIAPVIFLTIVTGIAGMRDIGRVGRVAAKAFAYFLTFSTLALIIGMIVANLVQPGNGLNIDPASLDASAVSKYSEQAHETTIVGFLTSIIPDTFVSAFSEGNILQVLFVSVLFGLALAMIGDVGKPVLNFLESISTAFFKLVKMIIAPVIFLTIVTGIAGMRDIGRVGRVAAKAFAYFLTFSTLALIIGMIVANLVQPGNGLNIDPATLDASAVSKYSEQAHETTIVGFLTSIIPDTFVSAFSEGNILQVLFVSVLFGLALAMIGDVGKPVLNFLESISTAFFKLVAILMKAAPIGAFGAFAFTIGKYGIGSIANLAALVATFYATAAIFVVGVLGLVGWANGFNILKLIRYLKEELLLVLGTSSSEAALPSLLQKMERAGAAKSVVGLVVPTGYSFNLDGTNIYMTMAALFIAQALNIDLSLQDQIVLLLVAMLSSKGAAGITGAGFITLAATLSVVPAVPVAGMALILGIDRFMSECRALTNFIGNAVATIVVARWEGDLDRDALRDALNGAPRPIAAQPDPAAGPGDKALITAD